MALFWWPKTTLLKSIFGIDSSSFTFHLSQSSVFLEDWHKKYKIIRATKRSMYSNYNIFFIYFYLEVSKDEPYFWIDDMFVTGILARKVPHEIKIYNWKNSFLSDHRSKTFAFFRLTTYLILSAPFRHFWVKKSSCLSEKVVIFRWKSNSLPISELQCF